TRLRGQLWRIGLAPHPTVNNYKHPRVAAWLRERLRSHDYRCVVVEELALAAYIPLLAEHCTVVFDEHNVEAKLGADIKTAQNDDSELSPLRRLSRRLWTHMLRREEAKAVRRADLTWACSATDAETLKAAYRSG